MYLRQHTPHISLAKGCCNYFSNTRILKISASYVFSPLTYVFNKILSTGTFLDRLKFPEVKPVFKKGDKTGFSSYRPISLLHSFSKLLKKLFIKDCIVI